MLIRKAVPDDLPEIVRLENVCFTDPWSERILKESLENPRSEFFVCVSDDGTLVGYAEMTYVFDEGDLTNIAVSPLYRKQGIGRFLLDKVFEAAKAHALSVLFLEVRISNLSAIRLYEKSGFTDEGIRKNYYSCPTEDACIMKKCFSEVENS